MSTTDFERHFERRLKDGSFFDGVSKKPTIIDLGAVDDYFRLFRVLRSEHRVAYLFESLSDNEHSEPMVTFGFDPLLLCSARTDVLTIQSEDERVEIQCDNPYQQLSQIIPQNFQGDAQFGGLIGSIGYEAVNYFEPTINLAEHDAFPTIEMGLYLDGLIYNAKTRELQYYFYSNDRSGLVIEALEKTPPKESVSSVTRRGPNRSKKQYYDAVDYAIEQIKSGNTFQAEIGFKTEYTITGDKIAVYAKLREINPGPYMYYLQSGERTLFGSSPEIIVRNSSDGRLLTTPAAGTVARGKDINDDERLGRQLQTDDKEIAEHNMLIDLHRNDLARVSRVGSVSVDRAKYIAKYSHVQHMLSDITSELADDKNSFDVLASMTPCGVLTGAPKIETIKIINYCEPEPRGPYGGAVGRFSLNGDCVFTMPIRSLFCAGDECFAQTASGVVLDSTADGEFAEITKKLAAMERVIDAVSEAGAV